MASQHDVSVDLIFAVPGQDHDTWCADLEKVVSLEPHHISLYNLTFEEGTPFLRWLDSGRLTAHDDDWQTEAYQLAVERLRIAGYERYEISNFALPGYASLHNRAYWDREAYLGMGPSAHSLFGRIHAANHFDLDKWSGSKLVLTDTGILLADELVAIISP